ncbi:MAG: NERD domain-containing protein [Anaerolineae bacterium]|nr:NERD domain-containing protein [Anaerolineae bacterium]
MNSELIKLVQLARSGRGPEALQGLQGYLREHTGDVEAWILLGGIAPSPKVAKTAFLQALQLDPGNVMARRGLSALDGAEPVSPVEDKATFFVSETEVVVPEELVMAESISGPQDNLVEVPELDRGVEVVEFVSVDDVHEAPVESKAEHKQDAARVAISKSSRDEFQALQQAKAMIWPFRPKSEPKRSLGELLAEGKVTRQDLDWASAHARDPKMRKMADVVLASHHRLPNLSMTLEEARLISWPFRRLNRPLGELVDTGAVKARDLRRAAWFAEEARLRQAARLLLPVVAKRSKNKKRSSGNGNLQSQDKLSFDSQSGLPQKAKTTAHEQNGSIAASVAQISSSARPMPVVQGSDYLTRQIRLRYRRQVIVTIVGLCLTGIGVLLLLWILVSSLVLGSRPPIILGVVSLVLMLPMFWLGERLVESMEELNSFEQGRLGEVQVARLLRQGLDNNWVLFRNLQLPGNKGDIDMVLLGPPGIFALEVKTYKGTYSYRHQTWYRRSFTGWLRMQYNPGKQARAGAGLLHEYIVQTLNRDVWVEPRLVWGGVGKLELDRPEVFVWFKDKLPEETKRLYALPVRISAKDQAELSGLLRGLCSTL